MDERKQIREIITRLLSRREHSRGELLIKLQQRQLNMVVAAELLDKFTEADIQSDARFAESYARQRVIKGYGPARIRAELKERQVQDSLIRATMEELQPDWFELAKAAYIKKYGEEYGGDWQELQKRQRYMQYRGFEQEHIRYACGLD